MWPVVMVTLLALRQSTPILLRFTSLLIPETRTKKGINMHYPFSFHRCSGLLVQEGSNEHRIP
jgi:hypothetical protein